MSAKHYSAWFAGLILVSSTLWSAPSYAFRPFDGTDAAVADLGELETEFQPVGYLKDGWAKSLIGPQIVLSYGLIKNLELTAQGQLNTSLNEGNGYSFEATAVGFKYVFREGSLQDKEGPSLAAELLLLTPGINTPGGFGFTLDAIASQRFDWGTVHFNVEPGLSQDQHASMFVSTILEGPAAWKVRPVAEFFYQGVYGPSQVSQLSGLVGLIYQPDDKFSFDLAYRGAVENGRYISEIRAGVTFGVEVGQMDFLKPNLGQVR
jgi:hypothetical protein